MDGYFWQYLDRCVLYYFPLLMDTQAPLEYSIEGNLESTTLIVFLQGWPDSKELWQEKMNSSTLLPEYKLMYIDFPNHGAEKISWGQDFKTIAIRAKNTIDIVPNVNKRILVCHDWGCVFGYVLDHLFPKYFQFIVALDVPAFVQISGGNKGKMFVMAYQAFLLWAFLIGGGIGNVMTRYASKAFKHEPSYLARIGSGRNFPYYYYWRNYIMSKCGKEDRLLKGYKPSVSVSYFFGKNKPMQFHGPRWVDFLKKTEGCSIQGLDAGHWFMGKYKSLLAGQIKRVAKL